MCSFNIHCGKRWQTIAKPCCGSRDQGAKDAQCLPSALPVFPAHRPHPYPPEDTSLMPTENGAGKAANRSLLPRGFLDQTKAELPLTDTCPSPKSLPAGHQVGELHTDYPFCHAPFGTASPHKLCAHGSWAPISAKIKIILHE